MNSLLPLGVMIDGLTGAVTPQTGGYTRRLSDLKGFFQNQTAWAEAIDSTGNPLVYEVIEFRRDGSDLFFGTTTMQPGKVGNEYFMTRGHFHQRRDMGEVYYTQSGSGLLLLESYEGESRTIDMGPGVCTLIPPGWAHRSINIGRDPLVFVWICNPLAGHDYGDILERGMRKLVIEQDGQVAVIPNSKFGKHQD